MLDEVVNHCLTQAHFLHAYQAIWHCRRRSPSSNDAAGAIPSISRLAHSCPKSRRRVIGIYAHIAVSVPLTLQPPQTTLRRGEARAYGHGAVSGIQPPDEAECWAEARNIVEQYGDDVGRYVQMMVDVCMERREYQLLLKWSTIRNCVAMLMDGPGSTATQ